MTAQNEHAPSDPIVVEPDVSVVVPISERHDPVHRLYDLYAGELKKLQKEFEFIFVLDGFFPKALKDLDELIKANEPVRIVKFSRSFGESIALMEGFRRANGKAILTLAAYIQVEPAGIADAFAAYDQGYDLVITRRFPRKDPLLNRIQSQGYHYLVRRLTGTSFRDITCGMRVIKRNILKEFVLYGDLHRFIPIFAWQRGIQTKEVDVPQRKEDTELRLVRPGVYLRRLLDILTLFFLVKFTRKPLRFFGLIGAALFCPGFLITLYMGALRIFASVALSNRPILLVGFLLMVFGLQILSVGLVGELILFNQAKDIRDYHVEQIIG